MNSNAKTDKRHWELAWEPRPRMRLPRGVSVSSRNIQRLLKRCISPGMRVLEIGCAPGKMLAWVAKAREAEVSGLDYSPQGIDHARRLFAALGIAGDLRCEDVFAQSFEEGSYDCVFSCGVVEHFDDPRELIEIHIRMLKPGGKALITIPNYAGVYGSVQRRVDPENLALHNLDIMDPATLAGMAPSGLVNDVRAYAFGRLTGALITMDRLVHARLARWVTVLSDMVGMLQPLDIEALCPLLVLEMTKKERLR